MGDGRVQWWMVNALEGREVRFCELLLRQAKKNLLDANLSTEEEDEGAEGGGQLPANLIGSPEGPVQGWIPQKIMKVSGWGC